MSQSSSKRKLIRKLLSKGKITCPDCGVELNADTATVDRIVPGAFGGTYEQHNIQIMCQPCNTTKGCEIRLPNGEVITEYRVTELNNLQYVRLLIKALGGWKSFRKLTKQERKTIYSNCLYKLTFKRLRQTRFFFQQKKFKKFRNKFKKKKPKQLFMGNGIVKVPGYTLVKSNRIWPCFPDEPFDKW